MIKCNHCGAKNENNAKICVVCGKEITNNEKFVDSNGKMPWYSSTWFIILMLFCFWPVSLYLIWKYKPEWVSSDWFTILWLICFAPVGLYLMWKHRKFSNIARVIVTVVVSVFWIWIFYYGSTRDTDVGIGVESYKQDSNDSIISTEKTNVDSNRAANEETKAELEKKDGWVLEDGYWYYYKNNKKEKSKFIEDYYVDDDGKMLSDTTKKIRGKNYKFAQDGKYTIVEDLELVGGIDGTTTRYDGYFATYISGVVRNNTDKKYSYLQITFDLFDKDDNKVGTALANVNNIGPGEKWKFEAMALEDFSSYRLDEIIGW